MSRRKENIRKICDDISAIGMILKIKTGKVNYDAVADILIKSAHRIKRTTWRGENKDVYHYEIKYKNGEIHKVITDKKQDWRDSNA